MRTTFATSSHYIKYGCSINDYVWKGIINMLELWRTRANETRKAKNISVKAMAEKSTTHMTEETLRRILQAVTENPGIEKVIDIAQMVDLEVWELFAPDAVVVGYKGFAVLQAEFEALKAEKEVLIEENISLREGLATATSTANALNYENDRLRLTMAHNEKTISLQEEIIALLKRDK